MKALVYTGPQSLEIRDVAAPNLQAGDELIQVESVGICGSDMHAWLGHDDRRPAPLILGHEAAGTIVAGARSGERVTINPLVTCGSCADCGAGRANLCSHRQIISMPPREGAFAEQLAMPAGNLVTIPDGISSEKASLAEPIACGWHGVRLAEGAMLQPLSESDCLVIGGGAIGLGAALVLVARGAKRVRVAETNAARRETLKQAGPFTVFDPAHAADATLNADLVIDGVGIEATRSMASAQVRRGGVIVHIGLGSAAGGLDIRRMTLQEITFIGTYTYTPDDFRQTAQAIFDGRLGTLDWPEIRPLENGSDAFKDIRSGSTAAPKIILKP